MLFIIYVTVSSIFLFSTNPFHHHIFMTSAGRVVASIYDTANSFTSYFGLKDTNEDLQRQTADLQRQLLEANLKLQAYEEYYHADTMRVSPEVTACDFIIATAINNSFTKPNNYLTINKGALDGIRPEMGIIDQNGIVGIVNLTSDHYARVISLLNPNFSISCKVKGSSSSGPLGWDGKNYQEALLREIPRHTVYNPGDTIVTSGYSAIFPEGIPVGTIVRNEETIDNNFLTLRVKLFTDFSNISTVRVISNPHIEEIKALEAEPEENDKKGKKK